VSVESKAQAVSDALFGVGGPVLGPHSVAVFDRVDYDAYKPSVAPSFYTKYVLPLCLDEHAHLHVLYMSQPQCCLRLISVSWCMRLVIPCSMQPLVHCDRHTDMRFDRFVCLCELLPNATPPIT
jgi:hypothetical protein